MGLGGAAALQADAEEVADAGAVQFHEGVALQQPARQVGGEEVAGVVAGEAEGGLGEVVGAEGEEVSVGGDGAGG